MKVVQINATCGSGSTGKICVGISNLLTTRGIENYILYSWGQTEYPLGIKYSNEVYTKGQALKAKVIGNYGFNSKHATKKLIGYLDEIKPNIVHLHNVHSHGCHLEMLFEHFKFKNIKIIWTFHDCWAFTGYCPHFTMANCNKWIRQCYQCIQNHEYSWFVDRSRTMYERKKALLHGLDLTIVTPSQWLAGLVKQSFLKDYPVKVINNGIDLDVFRSIKSGCSQISFSNKKKIILGVSFGWSNRKGLDVFIELSKFLPEDFQIVLIGTDDKVDRLLPSNIISIHRTDNQQQLAGIYAAADVFVNPTREDNYPTVNMEAIACGTPVITFNTGGSPEMLDETCGCIVTCDDVEALGKEIIRICESTPYGKEACLNKAKEFDQSERFKEYIELYEGINITGT